MGADSIRHQMQNNERQIIQYQTEIRKLNQKIDELEMLRNKFNNLQNEFSHRQSIRKSKLAGFLSFDKGCSVVRKYYNGMSSLLSGREYGNAYDGLSEGKQRISTKIRELLNEIDNMESKINRLHRSNSSLHSQWVQAVASEAAEAEG